MREIGYYWVKEKYKGSWPNDKWCVMLWHDRFWYKCGYEDEYCKDEDLEEIGEKITHE
jgi:hypothetical protein